MQLCVLAKIKTGAVVIGCWFAMSIGALAQSNIYVNQATGTNSPGTTGVANDPFKSITYAINQAGLNSLPQPWHFQIGPGIYDADPAKPADERESFPIIMLTGMTMEGDDPTLCILDGAHEVTSDHSLIYAVGREELALRKLTLRNSIRTDRSGGAVLWESCSGEISESIFSGNRATEGAAVCMTDQPILTDITIRNNVFSDNRSTAIESRGGALTVIGDFHGSIQGNTFTENRIDDRDLARGAGFCIVGNSTGDIDSNVFRRNTADTNQTIFREKHPRGAGFCITGNVDGNIINNVFDGNELIARGNSQGRESFAFGGGFFIGGTLAGNVTRNLFSGNRIDSSSQLGYIEGIGAGFFIFNMVGDIRENSFIENETIATGTNSAVHTYAFGSGFAISVSANSSMNTGSLIGNIIDNVFIGNNASAISTPGWFPHAQGAGFVIQSTMYGNVDGNLFSGQEVTGNRAPEYQCFAAFDLRGGIEGDIRSNIISGNHGSTGLAASVWDGTEHVSIICNNLFLKNGAGLASDASSLGIGQRAKILNNTFTGFGTSLDGAGLVKVGVSSAGATSTTLRNNILSNATSSIFEPLLLEFPIDYNNFHNIENILNIDGVGYSNDLENLTGTIPGFGENYDWSPGFAVSGEIGIFSEDPIYDDTLNRSILTVAGKNWQSNRYSGMLLNITPNQTSPTHLFIKGNSTNELY